jgi:hypothetical protein
MNNKLSVMSSCLLIFVIVIIIIYLKIMNWALPRPLRRQTIMATYLYMLKY